MTDVTFIGTLFLIIFSGFVAIVVGESLISTFFRHKEELINRMMKGEA